jgi:acyl dehydratase
MTITVQGIAGLKERAGQHLGYSDYVEITQEQVNLFAEATGDHQWIHVDPERAKKESPFGGPIRTAPHVGPGSHSPQIIGSKYEDGHRGCNKVRFLSPVGARGWAPS